MLLLRELLVMSHYETLPYAVSIVCRRTGWDIWGLNTARMLRGALAVAVQRDINLFLRANSNRKNKYQRTCSLIYNVQRQHENFRNP